MTRSILDHWQIELWAALAGLALGCIVLAMIYLVPLVRLRLMRGEDSRRRVVEGERRRLRRMEDALAVYEEHGHRDAEELRRDAEIHRFVLRRVERSLDEELGP